MNVRREQLILLIVALIILAGIGGYLVSTYKDSFLPGQTNTAGSAKKEALEEENKKLIAEVGKLIQLPVGEDPTVATVTDVTKLEDQPFFKNSKNGDKVLIYTQARKAILYDPAAKKVIDIAPINIGPVSASASASAEVSTDSSLQEEVKVVLLNGTKTVGLTGKIEPSVKKVSDRIKVVEKDNAESSSYDKTLIVVVNSSVKELADDLAKVLKATVSSLPAGEVKPDDADLLIILGKDKT